MGGKPYLSPDSWKELGRFYADPGGPPFSIAASIFSLTSGYPFSVPFRTPLHTSLQIQDVFILLIPRFFINRNVLFFVTSVKVGPFPPPTPSSFPFQLLGPSSLVSRPPLFLVFLVLYPLVLGV